MPLYESAISSSESHPFMSPVLRLFSQNDKCQSQFQPGVMYPPGKKHKYWALLQKKKQLSSRSWSSLKKPSLPKCCHISSYAANRAEYDLLCDMEHLVSFPTWFCKQGQGTSFIKEEPKLLHFYLTVSTVANTLTFPNDVSRDNNLHSRHATLIPSHMDPFNIAGSWKIHEAARREKHTHAVPEEDGVTQLLDPPNFSETLSEPEPRPPVTAHHLCDCGDWQRLSLLPLLTHPLTQTN